MKNCKKIMTASLLIAVGYTSVALAHNQTGTLGVAASGNAATDVYQVTCSNDGNGVPTKLFADVADLAPVLGTLVSVQIIHPATAKSTILSEDPIDGDVPNITTGVGFSPQLSLQPTGLNQTYIINVNKQFTTVAAAKGIESYNLMLHCQTATGAHTGTSWLQTLNQ